MKNHVMKLLTCLFLLTGIVIAISICTKVLSSHIEANAASAKDESKEITDETKDESKEIDEDEIEISKSTLNLSIENSLIGLGPNEIIVAEIESEDLIDESTNDDIQETKEVDIDEIEETEVEIAEEESTEIYISEDDQIYLQKIAFAEARTEGVECMALVMLTILNRVESDEFPNTIYEVITQKSQFTPVSNGSFASATPDDKTQEALDLVLSGWNNSQGSLYFESCSGSSWHSRNLTYLFQSGDIRFYK